MAVTKQKVYGKGVYEKGLYKSRINGKHTKAYNAWVTMLQRCYDPKFHTRAKTYIGTEVCDEWLYFQNFAEWFENNYVDGYDLDKDLLSDSKIYSPETCCFIPHNINVLLTFSNRKVNNTFSNVHKHRNKFCVHMRINGVQKHIGIFDTEKEALEKAKFYKKEYFTKIANQNKNIITDIVYNKLINI